MSFNYDQIPELLALAVNKPMVMKNLQNEIEWYIYH